MKNLLLTILFFMLFATSPTQSFASEADFIRYERIKEKLSAIASTDPAYLQEVDVSIGKISLSEMLRNIARTSRVNLTAKNIDHITATCNFSRTKITDLLFFVCKEYNLDLETVGNIVSVFPVAPPAPTPKVIDISYTDGLLSYDLAGEKLIDVTKKITALTKVNIIVPNALYTRQVTGFVKSLTIDEAIRVLGEMNALGFEKEEGLWVVKDSQQSSSVGQHTRSYRRRQFAPDCLSVDSLGMVTAQISHGHIQDIVIDLCEELQKNYFFVSPVDAQTSVYVSGIPFDTLLEVLMTGTPYSYYTENDIYYFGAAGRDGKLISVEVIPLTYRAVAKVEEAIPAALKAALQIKEFPELNSLIVCGDRKDVARIKTFVGSIDKSIPLVTIEIIIADVTKSHIREIGIDAGLSDAKKPTAGIISPGVDMNFSAQTVNSLINSFNGFGTVNLGRVTPEFYMNLQLLENNGDVDLKSTPKLSTLNGHEATLKSGETKYYKEVMNNYIGTQNPIQSESYTWKTVEANLSVKITPYVSLDNQITLDIEIEQSEFTAREEIDAPPGTATRSFKSLIRVQNEDMILLGGIDRNSKEKTSKGLPWIARVPILRWFFGSTKDTDNEHLLNVFIKPTIIQ